MTKLDLYNIEQRVQEINDILDLCIEGYDDDVVDNLEGELDDIIQQLEVSKSFFAKVGE